MRTDLTEQQWRRAFIYTYLREHPRQASVASITENMNYALKERDGKPVSSRTVNNDLSYMRDVLRAPIRYRRHRWADVPFYYWELMDPQWQMGHILLDQTDIDCVDQAVQVCRLFGFPHLASRLKGLCEQKLLAVTDHPMAIGANDYGFHRDKTPVRTTHPSLEDLMAALRLGTYRVTVEGRRCESDHVRVHRRLVPYRVAHVRGEWFLVASVSETNQSPQAFRLSDVRKLELIAAGRAPRPSRLDKWVQTHLGQMEGGLQAEQKAAGDGRTDQRRRRGQRPRGGTDSGRHAS